MAREWIMLEDLDAFAGEHTDPMAAFEEDILHRLTTSHGSNLDDEDFGESVSDWLSSSEDLDGMRAALLTEVSRDARTEAASAAVERAAGGEVRIALDVQADSGELLRIVRLTSAGELVSE
jgi:hypothetical protein